jgi:predicted MPP superfamily phosphohydrolase
MITFRTSIFYTIILILTYLIYVYPFDILYYLIFKENFFKLSSLLFTVVSYLIIIFYFKSNNTFIPIKLFVNEGMGIGFISFCVVNIGLLIDNFYSITSHVLGAFCFLSIIIITIYSLINGRFINLKIINIISSKVDEQIRLIFISDTHLGSNSKKHLEKILIKIKDLEFDLFLIGGDFIDSSSFDLDDLDILKNINKPILFISGNHEYYIKDYEKKLERLNKYNINFLDNDSFKYKKINFIGISDNLTLENQKNIASKLVHEDLFNLILVHKPTLWDHVYEKTDLMLSGHTHNGQIFPFNLIVRLQFKNIYGLYEKLTSKLYVSSGSGCWGPKMRLGSKNEIVEIMISKK